MGGGLALTIPTMMRFTHFLSAHRGLLCVDKRDGLLRAPTHPNAGTHSLIVGWRPAARPDLMLLTTATDQPLPFSTHAQNASKTSTMLFRCLGEHQLALMHPFSFRFLTASPTADAPLINTAEHARSWEYFEPIPVHPRAEIRRITQVAAMWEDILGSPPTLDWLKAILAEKENAGDLLNTLLPLLPTHLLDRFASETLDNKTTLALIAQAFAADPWATDALPALNAWRARRQDPAEMATLPAAAPGVRDIGPEFDHLGRVGLTGGYSSFAHGCTLRARRLIQPRRKVAMLATARNEGIYLLEWLAYHRCLGVDAFYLYSNDNDDGSDELLHALADAGVITWINSRLDRATGHAQFKAYGHALGFIPDLLDFDWTLITDLDELFVLDRGVFPTIGDYCDWQSDHGAESVSLSWAFIRSEEIPLRSGLPLSHRNQRLLTERQMGEGVRLVKSMSRPNRVCHSEAHVAFTDERSNLARFNGAGRAHSWHQGARGFPHSPKFADSVLEHPAMIYHYIYKSADEWLWKNARNPGGHTITSNTDIKPMNSVRAKSFMTQHDATDLKITRRATLCAPGQVDEIKALKRLPRIAEIDERLRQRYTEKLTMLKTLYGNSEIVAAWPEEAKRFLDVAKIQATAAA